jgi:Protein of unknown function (DUF1569)
MSTAHFIPTAGMECAVTTREDRAMPHKDLNDQSSEHYLNRIASIHDDSPRRWGTMTPARMLAHVSLLMEASMGELPVEGRGKIPFKWFKPIVLSGLLPFPRGRAKAPAVFLEDDPANLDTERKRLENLISSFLRISKGEPERQHVNPLFGTMTMTQWARLHGLHLNHHLSQFSA